jgi:glyoxylase-like metal-dependent hydrolase (beta-lactamase superfamily II)
MIEQPKVRLYVLDTGLIECADFALFSASAEPGTYRELTVASYLVIHPDGTLLWDTGIDDEIARTSEGRQIVDPIVFRVPRTLRGQLAEIGVAPDEIDCLGLSHLHVDHVGNVGLFGSARVLLQRAEYEAGYGPHPEQLIEPLAPGSYAALNRERIETIDGDHDLFGDGSVVLKSLPGHTPGHQGLLVDLVDTGPVLLAGDIAYSARDYAAEAVRQADFDRESSRHSIATAKRLERELGATVWLHHDAEAQRTLRTAPAHYE